MTSQDRWLLPEGVDELLPQQAAVAEQVRRDILDLYKTWGYQLVVPPLVEFTDSLLIGMGDDVAHQSFRLTDQLSGKPMAIRADITPQTARIDAHSMRATGTNRLCYAGSVLHTRPSAPLASRCPMQAGAELYGDAGLDADIEIISLMLAMLQAVDTRYARGPGNGGKGLHRLTLDLGHVGIYRTVLAVIDSLQPSLHDDAKVLIEDALQRKSVTELRELAPKLITDKQLVEIICQLLLLCGDRHVLDDARKLLQGLEALYQSSAAAGIETIDIAKKITGALDELAGVADVIALRFPEVGIYFDLTELRGYAYHTGLVFAAYADGHGSALANGGRYDDVGQVFGAARPATGFNTDVKTLINFIYGDESAGLSPSDGENADGVVEKIQAIAAPIIHDAALWEEVQALRAQGKIVVNVQAQQLDHYQQRLVSTSDGWVVR